MTYCPLLLKKVEKELDNEDNTNLKELAEKFCGLEIEHPEKKAKRLILTAKGRKWWEDNKSRFIDVDNIHNPTGKSGGKKFPSKDRNNLFSGIKEIHEKYGAERWTNVIAMIDEYPELFKLLLKHYEKEDFDDVVSNMVDEIRKMNPQEKQNIPIFV